MSSICSQKKLVTIKEASQWASVYLNRDISQSNISYLIQYGKVRKHNGGSATFVDIADLAHYYDAYYDNRKSSWQKQLGEDLNWALSFEHLREKDTTKHVHRLHPYKGKFIPQLVEYFLDNHIDDFKQEIYFKPGDIVLDPFAGSGTTLVQATEMGIHAIGIDISHFNCMIAEVKLQGYDFNSLTKAINQIKKALLNHESDNNVSAFDSELLQVINEFNQKHFPNVDFKYQVEQKKIDEEIFSRRKEKVFLKKYDALVSQYNVQLKQSTSNNFLDTWYCQTVRNEFEFVFSLITAITDEKNKKALSVILSRTIRSCRATTHSDLATLKEPQLTPYYCYKHKKICKPLYSIRSWFNRYANDTLKRLQHFCDLQVPATSFALITGDSQNVEIFAEIEKLNSSLFKKLKKNKIRGIFTSPPYVGQIDYHEQHAYAYDLFGFNRQDNLEIGPLYKGQSNQAKKAYVEGISNVLINCKQYLSNDFDIFLVANDKYNLYPSIVERANMEIVNTFKRPVLNRTERDKSPYSEIIFHIKAKRK
jgi:16S rRNA G966 N2-methylase RsmD